MTSPGAVGAKLRQYVAEATELVFSTHNYSIEVRDEPQDLITKLTLARAVLDRVDEIHSLVLRMRWTTRINAKSANEAYTDKWEEAARSTGTYEYTSAKEREAKYSTVTVAEKLTLRQTQKLDDDVAAAEQYLKFLRDHVLAAKKDIEIASHLISLQTRLEG